MAALAGVFRVAIFDEFLDAFARIPRAQQKKVNKFVRLFRQDPTSAGINYESISTFRDPNLRTVRIDEAYRAIVLKPETGNVYVLLWVDHHDEAMAWARHKQVKIHPETGGLQVLTGEVVVAPVAASVEALPLFQSVRDRELKRLGVPEELLGQVRAVVEPGDLDALQAVLPPEAYEALFFLGEGEPLEVVEQALAVSTAEAVDTEDFEKALERETTQRRFVVVDNDEALEAMLDAPLEKWRIFLHPSQRRLVRRSWNGPVRVLGGAGTGKTVVAMHRAAYLAEKVFAHEDDRILFTTFTQNLAADIAASLRKLCGPAVMRRIEVVNIDKWVSDLLRRAGYDYRVEYWGTPGSKLRRLWESALESSGTDEFGAAFYRDEWELVVQPQGCESWEDYRSAARAGRGRRVSRGQRKAIWPVFAEYRRLLDREGLREPEDALRDAAGLLKNGNVRVAYQSVVVDEAQDMSTNAFQLLRQIIPEERPNDLFIVGDGHQRIYRRRVVLGQAGVNILGRGRRLRINYRTTDEIRRYAVALLEGANVDDLDGGSDTTSGYKSLMHGEAPMVKVLSTFAQEVETIVGWIGEGDASKTCLVARTKALRDKYEKALQEAGLATYRINRSAPEDADAIGVRIATMHRVKGLEFDRMVLAGVKDGDVPLSAAVQSSEEEAERREATQMERALMYVATTRAKRAVLITAHGPMAGWVGTAAGQAGSQMRTVERPRTTERPRLPMTSLPSLIRALEDRGFVLSDGSSTGREQPGLSPVLTVHVSKHYHVSVCREADGGHVFVADWVGVEESRGIMPDEFLEQLCGRYAYHQTIAWLRESRWMLQSDETLIDGTIRLTVNRWGAADSDDRLHAFVRDLSIADSAWERPEPLPVQMPPEGLAAERHSMCILIAADGHVEIKK